MSWLCGNCKIIHANVQDFCYYCAHHKGIKSPRTGIIDIYDWRDMNNTKYEIWKTEQVEQGVFSSESREVRKIMSESSSSEEEIRVSIEANPNMSPKEKLFAKLFAAEVTLIADMDESALRAHIEDLQSIAFEARARLTASDTIARDRAATKKASKGFSATVAVDSDFTSNAIHNIEERKKKMTKVEKEIERLVGLGISRADAENMYRATTVNAIKKGQIAAVVKDVNRPGKDEASISAVVSEIVNFTSAPTAKVEFSNPFAVKAEEPITLSGSENPSEILSTPVSPIEVESEIKIETPAEPEPEAPKFINPFAAK